MGGLDSFLNPELKVVLYDPDMPWLSQESDDPNALVDPMCRYDGGINIDVYWGGYEYSIELARLKTQQQILVFARHMRMKTWRNTTTARTTFFIRLACRLAGIEPPSKIIF